MHHSIYQSSMGVCTIWACRFQSSGQSGYAFASDPIHLNLLSQITWAIWVCFPRQSGQPWFDCLSDLNVHWLLSEMIWATWVSSSRQYERTGLVLQGNLNYLGCSSLVRSAHNHQSKTSKYALGTIESSPSFPARRDNNRESGRGKLSMIRPAHFLHQIEIKGKFRPASRRHHRCAYPIRSHAKPNP